MLIWQNYLHILRSLFRFIFLIFSVCAGGSHHISSLLPKGICEGSWSCRNSNCSCSSCTWRLYRNFLLHWKKSSLYTSEPTKQRTQCPHWYTTAEVVYYSLSYVPCWAVRLAPNSAVNPPRVKDFCEQRRGWKNWQRSFARQQPCSTVKYERPEFRFPLLSWLEGGTPTTTLFIETLVYLHHHFLPHHHLLAAPEFPWACFLHLLLVFFFVLLSSSFSFPFFSPFWLQELVFCSPLLTM